jgi:hypothetical protein
VVLPESIWALIPMLRMLAMSVVMADNSLNHSIEMSSLGLSRCLEGGVETRGDEIPRNEAAL